MSENRETIRDCEAPWTWYQLNVDGTVTPCCFGSLPVGRVNQNSPEELWNGPTLRSLRSSLSAGVVHSVCAGASCKFVQNSPKPEGKPVPVPQDFDESWYVSTYPDVKEGVHLKLWVSGADHFQRFGHREFRAHRPGAAESSAIRTRVSATTRHEDYAAVLGWLGTVEPGKTTTLAAGPIEVKFRAKNLGLRHWLKSGNPDGHVYGAGQLHARLENIGRITGMKSFRMAFDHDVAPGESIDVSLKFDPTPFLGSRIYLLLDLGCDERFFFGDHPDSMSMPLVASLELGQDGSIVLDPGDPVDLEQHEKLVLETNRKVRQ